MEIEATKTVKVQAKTVNLYLKLRDECYFTIKDQDGDTLLDYEGYVPHVILPGEFGGYLDLQIDIDTGQILNWKTPVAADLSSFLATQREQSR